MHTQENEIELSATDRYKETNTITKGRSVNRKQ